ncbi:hypothetical protein HC024_12075 [Methylococcaceae bacterium WWC4]|nr:hypothetical protein [Methylococcaceae bacterium WWC4]
MQKLTVAQLQSFFMQPIHVLIGCVSYESRCLSVPFALSKHDVYKAVYFRVNEFRKSSEKNTDDLKNIFDDRVDIVEYSNKNSILFADKFIEQIDLLCQDLKHPLNIVLDISTFTREALIIAIGILFHKKKQISSLFLLYTPAAKMSDEWLSRGFRNVRSVLGFPGELSSLKPLHVVVMTGFELERAKYIIDEYEPDIISIGVGNCSESINSEFNKRNNKFVKDLSNCYGEIVNNFNFSLIDPVKTSNELESYLSQFSEYNTVIAPMNNKLSTIGAALYAIKHERVQICYLPAEEYNVANYSDPDDVFYSGEIKVI